VSAFRWMFATALSCCLAPTIAPAIANAEPVCPAGSTFDYMGVPVSVVADRSAYYFASDDKLVDADGAPNAYHPDDVPDSCPDAGRGIDCLASAGYPNGSWWQTVLAADPLAPDQPAVQQDGPYRGYFVSMTSLRNTAHAGPASPSSYVDAAQVPYLVLPAPIYRTDGMGEMGDIGWAINLDNGRTTPFVIADEGPVEQFGEASVAFWRALGSETPNPRNGEGLPDGRVAYVVFPGSGKSASSGGPIDGAALAREAQSRLTAIGGPAMLRACASGRPASGALPPTAQ
jgi:hypothetical protein